MPIAGVVPVKEVQGTNVIISVPFDGFGDRRPNPNELVAIVCDRGRTVAYPHWRTSVVDRLPEDLEERLTVEGRAVVVAQDVMRDDSLEGNRYQLFIAESATPEAPGRVVAIRRVP